MEFRAQARYRSPSLMGKAPHRARTCVRFLHPLQPWPLWGGPVKANAGSGAASNYQGLELIFVKTLMRGTQQTWANMINTCAPQHGNYHTQNFSEINTRFAKGNCWWAPFQCWTFAMGLGNIFSGGWLSKGYQHWRGRSQQVCEFDLDFWKILIGLGRYQNLLSEDTATQPNV